MTETTQRTLPDPVTALDGAPIDSGVVVMIVRRPEVLEREILGVGILDVGVGLQGDCWATRGSRSTPDGSAHPDRQVTLMSSRVIAALEPDRQRWALAGDQLFVDLDLSEAALPPGTQLAIGEAIIEITAAPHTGCVKFGDRFGADALRWVNAPEARALRLRGLNARVVRGGAVAHGDHVTRL